MGVAHDDKGIGIDLLHQLLHRNDVAAAEGAHDHLRGPAAVGPRSVQKRHAHQHNITQNPISMSAALPYGMGRVATRQRA